MVYHYSPPPLYLLTSGGGNCYKPVTNQKRVSAIAPPLITKGPPVQPYLSKVDL